MLMVHVLIGMYIISGVLQGSVLGYLLFYCIYIYIYIYIDDIKKFAILKNGIGIEGQKSTQAS